MPVVVAAKPFKEPKDPAAILCRPICQLVSRPVIEARRNNNIFVDVERCNDSLRKNVHNVVIGIRPTMEFGAERALPFLGLKNAVSIGSMKHKALEVYLPDATNLRPWLQSEVSVVTNAIGTFEKTNLGIKIRTDLAALYEKFEPAVPVVQASTEVGLTSRNKWRASLSRVTRQHEVLHHHDPRVYSSALIERRRCVARALIDGHEPNVRTARKRALYSEHSIVRIRVRPTRPGTCVEGT